MSIKSYSLKNSTTIVVKCIYSRRKYNHKYGNKFCYGPYTVYRQTMRITPKHIHLVFYLQYFIIFYHFDFYYFTLKRRVEYFST